MAFVVVEMFNFVRVEVPENVLLSVRRVVDAVERQVPAIEKQPVLRLIPLAKVEVPEVILSRVADSPPANVLVPCPAPTVIAAAKVEVAVVEVETMELNCPREANRFNTNRFVDVACVVVELTAVKFWSED